MVSRTISWAPPAEQPGGRLVVAVSHVGEGDLPRATRSSSPARASRPPNGPARSRWRPPWRGRPLREPAPGRCRRSRTQPAPTGKAPKLLVSTTWQPTSRNERWRPATTSGLVDGQDLRASLEGLSAEVVRSEAERLEVGPRRAVEDDEASWTPEVVGRTCFDVASAGLVHQGDGRRKACSSDARTSRGATRPRPRCVVESWKSGAVVVGPARWSSSGLPPCVVVVVAPALPVVVLAFGGGPPTHWGYGKVTRVHEVEEDPPLRQRAQVGGYSEDVRGVQHEDRPAPGTARSGASWRAAVAGGLAWE